MAIQQLKHAVVKSELCACRDMLEIAVVHMRVLFVIVLKASAVVTAARLSSPHPGYCCKQKWTCCPVVRESCMIEVHDLVPQTAINQTTNPC